MQSESRKAAGPQLAAAWALDKGTVFWLRHTEDQEVQQPALALKVRETDRQTETETETERERERERERAEALVL